MFWITGLLSFFLSPVIDNLTTALVMCAVVMAIGQGNPRFIGIACVNIVVAANAGGAFSPFGDITTLMVWQRGIIGFETFFALFIPSVVNFVVPAAIMSLAVPTSMPAQPGQDDVATLKRGARRIMLLFVCTITTAVSFHNFLHLPPFLGMMTGLAALKFFGYYLRRTFGATAFDRKQYGEIGDTSPFDSFREVSRVEWDTLLFFFGVIMCVGGLGFIGYLDLTSTYLYGQLGPTIANILVGVISSLVDNIPVMVAVLEMHPDMSIQQWLLVTLTAGVGGSLLSIGSAAGIALMGQARGQYTFFTHLRWTPAIALGYGLSIWLHMIINSGLDAVMPGG
jgi:Na+/H+ antiporter NhaD/arsenite permease-like protein